MAARCQDNNSNTSSTVSLDLPPEILRAIASHLISPDLRSARSTCTTWAAALAPLATQLRFVVADEADATTTTAQPASTSSTSSSTTPAPAKSTPPLAQQLAAVLDRLVNVHSVALLLTPTSKGQDLRDVLLLVGSKAGITELNLCELPDKNPPLSFQSRRAYGLEDLQLHHLRHVRQLRIVTLSWSLASIWRQLAALHSASSSNGSSSSGGCGLHTLSIEYAPGSRVYQLSCNFKDHPCQQLEPQHHHNQQLQLPTSLKHLTTPLPGQHHITSDCKLAVQCSLQESHESYLAALAAGLPDLHSLTVIGTYEGQEEVLTGYKQLQQLRCSFGGAFRSMAFDIHDDGDDAFCVTLASRTPTLRSLHVIPGPAAACGTLTGQLQARDRSSSASAEPILRDSIFMNRTIPPFKLEWLRHNTSLQHLSVPLIASRAEDVSACRGQLRSLVGQCAGAYTDEEVLHQIAAVGANLTSLVLYQSELEPTPTRATTTTNARVQRTPSCMELAKLPALQSLTLFASSGVLWAMVDPAAVWSKLTALTSLKLQNVGVGYRAGKPTADRVVVVVSQQEEQQQQQHAQAHGAARSADQRLWLWLCDLPCSRLQRLELSRYRIVVGSAGVEGHRRSSPSVELAQLSLQDQQQQQQKQLGQGAAGGSSSATVADTTAAANSSHSGRCDEDLSNLQQLSLMDCSCLVVQQPPQQQQPQQQPQGAGSSSSGGGGAQGVPLHCVAPAPIRHLLQLLLHPTNSISKLQLLELHTVPLGLFDVQFIACSPLGQHLEQLGIVSELRVSHNPRFAAAAAAAEGWDTHTWPSPPAASGVSGVIAAAAGAGRLQQLRTLWLDVSAPLDAAEARPDPHAAAGLDAGKQKMRPGLSLMVACCSLPSLQHLRLVMDITVAGGWPARGFCDCRSSTRNTAAAAGASDDMCAVGTPLAWDGHERLQQLRLVDVRACCGNKRDTVAAQAGAFADLQGFDGTAVDTCRVCGCAMPDVSVLGWLQLTGPCHMPGCTFDLIISDE